MAIQPNSRLTTKEAAQYLGFQATTLRNARYTGKLAGVEPPAYTKLNTVVRYNRSTLDDWLGQFQEQTSTAQGAAHE